jgi:tetratricopeptide (TPR) repeat protein/tRNA A-37 threonylcarbamoyl transferase component Bud32
MASNPMDCSEAGQRLDEIIASYLEAEETGQAPDQQELLRRHPDLAAPLAQFFANQEGFNRLAAPLRPLASAALAATPPPGDTSLPGNPEDSLTGAGTASIGRSFGDYELLQEIGRGGMGVVYKARQKGLGRLVALKMVRSTGPAAAADRQRFRNEAEMAAHLDHPQIVPIYEVGERDGQPYFSMKLIDGGSLAGQLARFGADLRSAARLLAAVARAVHHAHQRGILHRDLKPGNILLDGAGQPHVTDFGLAKRVAVDSSLTHSGELVGTPSYMAPEQTTGQRGAITTATDVYGLGAILYALLTGRPPFRGDTPLDTLNQVRRQEPEPPSRSNPRVDRDLETICLKCLEKDSQRRYGSAEALAEDLERWLVGEPIRARRSNAWERTVKWAKRRPALAGLMGISGAAAVALLVVSLLYNMWLKEERDNVRTQRDKARERFQLARNAVDEFYMQVSVSREMKAKGVEKLRTKLLEMALEYYQRFAEEADDFDVQAERAVAYWRLGKLYRDTARSEKAEQAYHEALAIFQHLVAARAETPQYLQHLAAVRHNLAFLYEDTERSEQAEQAHQEALLIRKRLVAAHPGVLEYQHDLAQTHQSLGALYQATGRAEQAQQAHQGALDILKPLAAAHPEVSKYHELLADVYNNLGHLHNDAKRRDPARQSFLDALTIRKRLAVTHPEVPQYQSDLAVAHESLGILYSDTGSNQRAEEAYREALSIRKRLVAEHPLVVEHAIGLASSYGNLGRLMSDEEKPEAALDWFALAVRTLEDALQKEPRETKAREFLIIALWTRADVLSRRGRRAETLSDWDRALSLDTGKYRIGLRFGRAVALARQGNHARATAEVEEIAGEKSAMGDTQYNAACVYALSSTAVQKDADLTESQRNELAEQYAVHAVSLLHKAHAAGHFGEPASVANLKKDADLAPLRERDDFKKLLAALEEKAKTGAR